LVSEVTMALILRPDPMPVDVIRLLAEPVLAELEDTGELIGLGLVSTWKIHRQHSPGLKQEPYQAGPCPVASQLLHGRGGA
jgi:hypothetical protein